MCLQVQDSQEKMLTMQGEYRKQIDNLEVNLSTTSATLLRRENEIKMLREGVSTEYWYSFRFSSFCRQFS